jgi:hypothetical protein
MSVNIPLQEMSMGDLRKCMPLILVCFVEPSLPEKTCKFKTAIIVPLSFSFHSFFSSWIDAALTNVGNFDSVQFYKPNLCTLYSLPYVDGFVPGIMATIPRFHMHLMNT